MPPIPVNIPVLSAQDRSVLKRMIDDWKHAPKAAPGRIGTQPEPAKQSPDVYIALTPAGGIAERSGLVPGFATCAVWKVVAGSLIDAGFTMETVANLSTTPIAGDAFICIKRDKFETWIADVQGGGGGDTSVPVGGFASVHETDIRCESGLLNQYRRTVTISVVANQLTTATGEWTLSGVIGCCDADCVTTGTGADDMSWYCLTPISTVEVLCGGTPVQLPRLMCVSTRDIISGEPPGSTIGCQDNYAIPVRMSYLGTDAGIPGNGRRHFWQGQDIALPCARGFNVTIEERLDDCLVTLSGSLNTGVNEGTGPMGPVMYPDAHTAYLNSITDEYVYNPSVIESYYIPIQFVTNRFSLDTDLYMVFATATDYHAGLYVVTPCIENELVPGTGTTPAIGASECHGPITRAQLQTLLDSGYLQSGGPFTSQAECLAACQPPPDVHTGTGSHDGFYYCMQTPDASAYGCLLLTVAELSELVDAGWTIQGGGFYTESECDESCALLTGTGTFGRCPCEPLGVPSVCYRLISGGSVVNTWNFALPPVGDAYRATGFAGDGSPLTLELRCINGQYYMNNLSTDTQYHMRVINCATSTLLYVDDTVSIRVNDSTECFDTPTGTGSGGGGGGTVIYSGSVMLGFTQLFLDGAGPFPGITAGTPVSGGGLMPGTTVLGFASPTVLNISAAATASTFSVPYTFG